MSITFEIPHHDGNPRNSEGSFVTLNDGRILFAYTQYKGDAWGDACPADIVGRLSSDDGRSWSEPFTIVENDSQNVMSVSLLRLKDGRIGMFYLRKSRPMEDYNVKPSASGVDASKIIDCRPWFCFSSDEGKSWSKPVDIASIPFKYLVLNNDRVIQLKSGRLIVPVAYHWLRSTGINPRSVVFFYISDDCGENWHESAGCCCAPANVATGLREPGVIELEDDRILCWCRSGAGFQFVTYSNDSGENWSQPEIHPNFTSPDSPLSIRRNPANGELFAIWSDTNPRWGIKPASGSWNRTPLVLARSNDDGATWQGHQILESEPDHGYCYTAIHFTQCNALLLAYCCGGGDTSGVLQDLRIRRIDLNDLSCL